MNFNLTKCNIMFNVCSDYSRLSSMTSMQQSLGWDTLEVRRHLSAVTMMFKVVHNLNRLTLPASINLVHSCTRSNQPYKFRHIFAHSNAYKVSFFPRTIPLWNSLPMSAVNANMTAAVQSNAIPIIRSQFCQAMSYFFVVNKRGPPLALNVVI